MVTQTTHHNGHAGKGTHGSHLSIDDVSPMKTDLLPPLLMEERAALEASISIEGVLDPIRVAPDGQIVDGAARFTAWQRVADTMRSRGETPPPEPRLAVVDLSPYERVAGRRLAVRFARASFNSARRQLSHAQRTSIAEALLVAKPTLTDEAVARVTGLTTGSVGRVRSLLQLRKRLPAPTMREDDAASWDAPAARPTTKEAVMDMAISAVADAEGNLANESLRETFPLTMTELSEVRAGAVKRWLARDVGNAGWSDAEIAKRFHVRQSTVRSVRRELVGEGAIHDFQKRVGGDGRLVRIPAVRWLRASAARSARRHFASIAMDNAVGSPLWCLTAGLAMLPLEAMDSNVVLHVHVAMIYAPVPERPIKTLTRGALQKVVGAVVSTAMQRPEVVRHDALQRVFARSEMRDTRLMQLNGILEAAMLLGACAAGVPLAAAYRRGLISRLPDLGSPREAYDFSLAEVEDEE